MIEPELLRTLERLENEEILDVNPELPLPAAAGGEDYLSILQDLREALGEPEEPEKVFADPQNILELGGAQEIAPRTAEFENELELLTENAGFDFSADEAGGASSDLEFKLPDEILFPNESGAGKTNDSELESLDSQIDNFEPPAEPENLPSFFHSPLETVRLEPDVEEAEEDSVSLKDFLSTQEFSPKTQTADAELSEDLFDFQTEDASLGFAPPDFFNEFDFEENSAVESASIFDSAADSVAESNENDFAFIPGAEETEFPEILHDEEQIEEFPGEEFALTETLASETVSDFEGENFAPDAGDFSDFLPDVQRDFLNELEGDYELPQFEAAENSLEMLPEPLLADEVEETNEVRSPFVVFKLDAQYFAFPALTVAEICHEPQFTSLPFVPQWFSGVTNLRGDVIAVLDLRRLWEMTGAAPTARRKMLVVHSERENLYVGLLVDSVSEIRYLGEGEIDFAPKFSDQPFAFCTNGNSRMNESLLPILDVERFLASPKLRQI